MNAFFETHDEHFFSFRRENITFPLHLHSQMELFLLHTGAAKVQIQQDIKIMHAGELAVIFPNQIHSYQALEDHTECTLVICDLEYAGGYAQTLLNYCPANSFIDKEHVHPDIHYALYALAEEKEGNNAAVPHLVQLILSRLLSYITLQRNMHAGKQELVNRLVQYIALHFRESITLTSLAGELNVSKYHVSRVFSERIQENFPSYLANIRLSYACSKLRETSQNVTEIAIDAGFESYRTFFRAFQKKLGMTPGEYRRNAQLSKEC